jgi:hypothetical protein
MAEPPMVGLAHAVARWRRRAAVAGSVRLGLGSPEVRHYHQIVGLTSTRQALPEVSRW